MKKMGGSASNKNCLGCLSVLDGCCATSLKLSHSLHDIFHAYAHVAITCHNLSNLQPPNSIQKHTYILAKEISKSQRNHLADGQSLTSAR